MPATLHIVDAFASVPFSGNPAAVCVLEGPRDDEWMQQVAREMNLSETAFLHPIEGGYALRWFTPATEVDLCGHATLAAAFVLWETGRLAATEAARFLTKSGRLVCRKLEDAVVMDFPAVAAEPCAVPERLAEALGCAMLAVWRCAADYLVEVADEAVLRALTPNHSLLATLKARGIIVTSRSATPEFDFVSRFFAPAVGIYEDPVTGSAHCALGPYWRIQLGRDRFLARQLSTRGGVIEVEVHGDRVLLRGQAVLVSRVELLV